MDEKTKCPFCGSPKARLWEALYTVRIVTPPEGGRGTWRRCPVFRCMECGRTFDEVEAAEGPDQEEDGGPSWD